MTPQQRVEDLRLAILEFLAARQAVAIQLETLVNRLNKEGTLDFIAELGEVNTAIAFLLSFTPPLISEKPAMLGSTRSFQATSAGVLAVERGTI